MLHLRLQSSNNIPSTAQYEYNHQRGQDTCSSLVAGGDGIDRSRAATASTTSTGSAVWSSTSGGVTLRGATGRVGKRARHKIAQIALENLQRVHLLADTVGAIPAVLVPSSTAGDAPCATGALLRGCYGGSTQAFVDGVVGEGCDFCGAGHPSCKVCFERQLVDVAVGAGFAGDLEHDVGCFVEEGARAV
jgi:hypothetical protein